MGDDWNGNGTGTGNGRPGEGQRGDPFNPYDEMHDELERQARETVDMIRENVGDLGSRVRLALDRAAALWDQAAPDPRSAADEPPVAPADEQRARALARRWTTIDFLVEPDLADALRATAVHDAAIWRVELRERGETRSFAETTEPYRGTRPPVPGPQLPAWDYTFATVPEIESGERRERLEGGGLLAACLTCNGTGHRQCAACEGHGFVQCPICHGRARTTCKRCRGRGRIADERAERRARAEKSYMQVRAERLAADATDRIADLAERLRQEYGVPLPPAAQWMPTAPASGETIPCPDCTDGTIACSCGNGKRVCEVCQGSTYTACPACAETGRVIRYRELVRRFDTRIVERTLPVDGIEISHWITEPAALRRVAGEPLWEGRLDALDADAPAQVPASVWAAALDLANEDTRQGAQALASQTAGEGAEGDMARRVISRRMRLVRVPLTYVAYTYGGHPFAFTAVGQAGAERFWAQDFPPRWSRVSRFVKALARDLGEGPQRPARPGGEISTLDAYRARREAQPVHIVIEEEYAPSEATQVAQATETPSAPPSPPAPDVLPHGE